MSTSKRLARLGANTLPVYRAYRGLKVAEHLRSDMKNPADRSWRFAARVAFDAATDTADGILARYAGTTRFGGYIDQLADKAWYLAITRQLVENGELDRHHLRVALWRDIGTTAVRPVAELFGLETDAQLSGKIKMNVQTAAAIAACSPLSVERPELVRGLFDVATIASVASGLDMLRGYAADLGRHHATEPAAQFIIESTTGMILLAES